MRLAFLFFSVLCVGVGALEIAVKARSAVLMNAETGAVLFEKEAHALVYPASTTKIATAVYILEQEKLNLGHFAVVSQESLRAKPTRKGLPCLSYWHESDGTMAGLVKGERISLDALLHGLMMRSGNDAANVLAEWQSGTVTAFIGEMNQYVRSLGCTHTHFSNPHGLHDSEHYTTAYDMCLIAKRALQFPKFRQIVSVPLYRKLATNKQPEEEWKPSNRLVKPGRFHYPLAIGIKTGYTSKALCTLVAAAEKEGRLLIAAVMGCENNEDRYGDAHKLFNAAFAEKKEKKAFFGSREIFTQQVAGGKQPLLATLDGPLEIEFFPSEEPVCKAFLHWAAPSLPIRKGAAVGEVQIVSAEGKILARKNLIAKDEVSGTFLFTLRQALGL